MIEERRADGDLGALNRLRDQRKDRAPEDGEDQPQEEQIVQEEACLARKHRIQMVLRAKAGQTVEEQAKRSTHHNREKGQEERSQ